MTEPLTRDQARAIAHAFAEARDRQLACPMIDGEGGAPHFPLYISWDDYPEAWWIVVAAHPNPTVLRSSMVIGVHKTTHEVRRLGDAGDEG